MLAIIAGKEVVPLDNQAWHQFEVGFTRGKRQLIRQFIKPYGVNYFEGLLIFAVASYPKTSQKTLAQHLLTDESSVARSLRNLEGNGWIQRQEDPTNHRKKIVQPTAKAQKFHEQLLQILAQWDQILFAHFTKQELTIFNQLVQRVSDEIQQIDFTKVLQEVGRQAAHKPEVSE